MIIAISNLKGGVGKTTVTQNLAVALVFIDYSVAILDTDQNGNSLAWSGVRDEELKSIFVAGSTNPKAISKQAKELDKNYDFVLIDGTPSLSEMTTRIILASDLLIIPIHSAAHDIRAVQQFIERIDTANEFRDSDIKAFFFLNQFESFGIQQTIKEVIASFEIPVLATSFKRRVSYIESSAEGKGVLEWSDDKAKEEVLKLANELLEIIPTLQIAE